MSSLAGVHAATGAWIALQGAHCIPDRQTDRQTYMWPCSDFQYCL